MASLNKENGGWRVLVVMADGRKTIRLGKMDKDSAMRIKGYVESLASAKGSGQAMNSATAAWLSDVPPPLHKKLAKAGLVEPRQAKPVTTIGGFIERYILSRTDIKPWTRINLERAKTNLLAYFTADRSMASVTAADADGFRLFLLGKGMAENTTRRICGRARQFWRAAIRAELVQRNPFDDLPVTVGGNPSRRVFVRAEDVRKVIDVATDPQWKLLIALARWGGLRVPSEALALTWADVDFEHSRFTVRSSKNEKHASGVRVVPMFPELAGHFQAVFDDAPVGEPYVIGRYRDPGVNLRTQLNRFIQAAGLTPWPKLWQNLRATRATELADKYPSHVAASWLGHAEGMADAFYRQVTDEHFSKATARQGAQNPAQQADVKPSIRQNSKPPREDAGLVCSGAYDGLRGDTGDGKNMQVPPEGLEPSTR
ncbi:MAG: site-specific integrase [Phycisphaeraceae bacterium]|nr:site-specific integrase [Phycisphaeraceae bacterium]